MIPHSVSIEMRLFLIYSIVIYRVYSQLIGGKNGLFPFPVDTSSQNSVFSHTSFQRQTVQRGLLSDEDVNGRHVSVQSDVAYPVETFSVDDYTAFHGFDDTSMFATSVSIGTDYAIVGANGYSTFNGAVYIYSITEGSWTLKFIISSPDSFNSNFGLALKIDGTNIMISANGQSKFLVLLLILPLTSYFFSSRFLFSFQMLLLAEFIIIHRICMVYGS
jgi:hypothetical protein